MKCHSPPAGEYADVRFRVAEASVGACCFIDGSCQELTATACTGAGGDYQGDGADCNPNPCPPAGACCIIDGSCQVLTQTACLGVMGSYQGDGSDCDPNPCPQPLGACCFADGSCAQLAEDECLAVGGTSWAPGPCTPNPCPQPVRAGNLNCDGVVNIEDIPHFVQALIDSAGYDADHDGSPYPLCDRMRADVNPDGMVDGRDIQPFVNLLLEP